MDVSKYYNYFLGFIVIFSIVLIWTSLITNPDNPSYVEHRTEQTVQEIKDLKQENGNLKTTVSTFEAVISTLEADNQKLSEIIEKTSKRISGWGLCFLLLFTSTLTVGVVIFIQEVKEIMKINLNIIKFRSSK